jgi:hypothetical protein
VADTSGLEWRRRAIAREAKSVMLTTIQQERQANEAETVRLEQLRTEYEEIVRQLRDGFDGNHGPA